MDLLTPTPRFVCSYSIPWNQTDVDSYQTQMYPRFIIGGRRHPVFLTLQHYTWLWKELNHRKILMPQEDLCSLFKRCVCLLVKTTACNFVLDGSGLKITAGQRGHWPAKNASWPVTFLPSPVILTAAIFSCLPMWFLTSWIKTWNYDVSKQVSNSLFQC
jgi:hypothetical protein